jgi:hypothetical protein
MHARQGKAYVPLIALFGGLVAALGGLTAVLAATGTQPVVLGITLSLSMMLLLILGIFIGLLRKRS